MVDRAKPHVGRDTTPSEAMGAALREAALPSGMSQVREELAEYVRQATGTTHVGRLAA